MSGSSLAGVAGLAGAAGGPVEATRVADLVGDRIRELIIDGQLDDGERLPRLDDLCQQFGVSLPAMREALRLLEAEGLVSVQRGNVGGSVVHRPTDKTAAHTLALVLRSRKTSVGDVAEAMALLDPVCAAACARRSDRRRAVVAELRKLNTRARDLAGEEGLAFTEAMAGFHEVIVRECGNNTLTLLAGALGSVWAVNFKEWARTTHAQGELPDLKVRLADVEDHERITELIDAGDDTEVAKAMTEHIDMEQVFATTDPGQPLATHKMGKRQPR